MASPIILGFKPGESLTSLNSLVVGAGASWGELSMPLVPLEFTPEKMANAIGPNNGYATGRVSFSNEKFYEDTYSGLPYSYKHKFWGESTTIKRKISGIAIGLSGGSILSASSSAIKLVLGKIVGGVLSAVSLDALQSSTSSDALVYGRFGLSTYDAFVSDYKDARNIFIINMGIGCVTQGALNIVFIGDFPSTHEYSNPLKVISHLYTVHHNAKGYAIIADAAVGFIMPGLTVSFLST